MLRKAPITAILFALTIYTQLLAQQPVPAPAQSKRILLIGGTAHIGNGTVIERAAIGFNNGKIDLVTDMASADRSKYEEIVDVTGKQIYPGFIAPNSIMGLVEFPSVRATRDFSEVGRITPHVRSAIAFNTDSKIPPTVRNNGVLMAQITPRSGLIPGKSSVFELEGWNWEDALLREDDGVHMNWPKMFVFTGWWAEPGGIEKGKEYEKQVTELKQFFRNAKAYAGTGKPQEKNLRFEAMKEVFNGTQSLYIHVDYVKEITEAVNFAKELGIKKIVLVGGKDAWMVPDLLKENNVSVIVAAIHELPDRTDDDIDQPFKLPYLLKQAGILFCLNNEGDNKEATETRNLPFYAGTTVKYGLSKEEAITSITLSAAKILGIDNRVGTLEPGKDATLFVSTGDALDMMSNNIELAYVRGKKLDLNDEQKGLYKRFKAKYGIN